MTSFALNSSCSFIQIVLFELHHEEVQVFYSKSLHTSLVPEIPVNREFVLSKVWRQGFPGGAVVENLPANAGDTGSNRGLGRSHMPRGN